MKIGIPSEIKADEYRVAMTPAGVRELTARGHEVLRAGGAGEGSAMATSSTARRARGSCPTPTPCSPRRRWWSRSRSPSPGGGQLRQGQMLFTYLHLAAEPELTRGLWPSGATLHRL